MRTARALLPFLGAILLSLAPPAAAGATPSAPVTLSDHIVFGPVNQGTFTATAPLCPSGTLTGEAKAVGGAFVGGDTTRFTATTVDHFTCADGSGTFTIQFHPQGDVAALRGGPTPWVVLGGTGAYSAMHGAGDFFYALTSSPAQGLVEGFETFTGEVHFD